MSSNATYQKFLKEDVYTRLSKLTEETKPKFGLMTPQHMVEHLILMTKLSVRVYGEVPKTATEGQMKFKKFIEEGANFEFRPSNKTVADLPKLKYGSLQEALDNYPQGINGFYNHYVANPEFISFNKFQGKLGFEDLEFLHYRHFEYHLGQFGL